MYVDYEELVGELFFETIVFCSIGLFIWIFLATLLYREQWKSKKRRRKSDMFVILGDDDSAGEGEAKYMATFYTGSTYLKAPSGTVQMHLLGTLYPGKIHELQIPRSEEDGKVAEVQNENSEHLLFPPLCRDKFLMVEDVCLGRLIGIVLSTSVEGKNPFWDCETVIVRDVNTNEAWYYKVHSEISFPPKIFYPATYDELCTFKFSFKRRFRREMRCGQWTYFCFWFKSSNSAFTSVQRMATALTCYMQLIVLSSISLNWIYPPGEHEHAPIMNRKFKHRLTLSKNMSSSMDKVLKYESPESLWLIHFLTTAIVVGVITSILGFILVRLFRQPKLYENHFEEMDYVIGTALHEHDHMKEIFYSNHDPDEPINIKEHGIKTPELGSEKYNEDEHRVERSYAMTAQGGESSRANPISYPADDSRGLSLNVSENSSTNKDKGYTVKSLFKGIASIFQRSSENEERKQDELTNLLSNEKGGESRNNPTVSTLGLAGSLTTSEAKVYPRRSFLFEPASNDDSLDPYHQRVEFRKLFLGKNNIHEHFLSSYSLTFQQGKDQKKYLKKRRTTIGSGIRDMYRRKSAGSIQQGLKVKHEHQHGRGDRASLHSVLPYENPNNFVLSTNVAKRKWFEPIAGWIFVLGINCVGVSLLIVSILTGSYVKRASRELFLISICSTYIMALVFGSFILEPLKIIGIAAYYAYKDKNMYHQISSTTKANQDAAEVQIHMNST